MFKLVVLTCCIFALHFVVADVDGDLALNHAISLAIGNAIANGDLQTIQVTSTDLSAMPGSCKRDVAFTMTSNNDDLPGRLGDVYRAGKIRIGISTAYNSSVFFAQTDGESVGYLAEVARIMTSHLGLVLGKRIDPEMIAYDFENFIDDSLKLFDEDQVDTILDVLYLAGRINRTDFTCAYERAIPVGLYAKQNSTFPNDFVVPSNLEGWNKPEIRVATVGGTAYSAAAEKYLPLAQHVSVSSDAEVFESLGVSSDVILQSTQTANVYNAENTNDNEDLVLQEGTSILFAGGASFVTARK